MPSKVFALRKSKSDLINEIHKLYDAVAREIVQQGESVCLKLHFGEPGNTAYLKPQYVKPVVDMVRKQDARPFLTDANTLYKGGISDTKTHHSKETMGADVIIARAAITADSLIVLTHFKGHDCTGFGGASDRAGHRNCSLK